MYFTFCVSAFFKKVPMYPYSVGILGKYLTLTEWNAFMIVNYCKYSLYMENI